MADLNWYWRRLRAMGPVEVALRLRKKWFEFQDSGRDHWPAASFFFLAGGGFRHGQVIGSTNSRAEVPKDRPVHLQHVFHTVYHQLGIDANTVTFIDPNGRPQYLLENRELIHELI